MDFMSKVQSMQEWPKKIWKPIMEGTILKWALE